MTESFRLTARRIPTGTRSEWTRRFRLKKPLPLIIERKGQKIEKEIVPRKVLISGGQEIGELDIQPDMGAMPTVVSAVEPNTPAAEAGMQADDVILAVNGEPLRSPQQLGAAIQENKEAPITLLIERNGQQKELTAQARELSDGRTAARFRLRARENASSKSDGCERGELRF